MFVKPSFQSGRRLSGGVLPSGSEVSVSSVTKIKSSKVLTSLRHNKYISCNGCRARTVLSSLFTDFNIILTRKVTALFAQFYRTLFCTILLHNTLNLKSKV